VARINSASQRTDPPLALAHAPWVPVIGACAIVVAPPADHPVFALSATTDTGACPPKQQRARLHDARILARERSLVPAAMIAALRIFMHAFERA
jgi:hypothetical protein